MFKYRNLKDIFLARKGAKIEERSKENPRHHLYSAEAPEIPTRKPQEDREIPIPLRFLYLNVLQVYHIKIICQVLGHTRYSQQVRLYRDQKNNASMEKSIFHQVIHRFFHVLSL
jgi:hypothetical protein